MRSVEQFIQTAKGLEFKLKKILGFRNMQEKLENKSSPTHILL